MKMHRITLAKFLIVLATPLIIISCRKTPDTSQLLDDFVVQTSKDPDANFSTYKTYYISDTIALRTTNPNDTLWTDNDAKQLVAKVKSNMAARGYVLTGPQNRPDLGLGLSAVKNLNIGVIYPGWWWGYWGGCYWYYYCGYYPYYPMGGMIYSVPTGTLILDMIDLKNATANDNLTVIWGSVMSGGLGNTSNDLQLGMDAIDQSFAQSPYIQTN